MTVTMEMHEQLETAPIPDLRQISPDDEHWQEMVGQEERHRDLDAALPTDFGPCPDWCALDHTRPLMSLDEIHAELPLRERDHERNFGPFTVCRTDRLDMDGRLTIGTPYLLTLEVAGDVELPAARALLAELAAAVDHLARVSPVGDATAQVLAEQDAVAQR